MDYSFIKKTTIPSNVDLHSIGSKKNPFVISPELKRKVEKEFNGMSKKELEELSMLAPHRVVKCFQHGSKIMRWDVSKNYRYIFDFKTGVSLRSDYLDDSDNETGNTVFAASFPHLIDVGIMGHCTHGQSGLCLKSGVQCYQDGLNISMPNMTVENFERIAKECKNLTNQFALGGRGDPNEHENFEQILKIARANNIIPNYTTSGFGLRDEQISLSKKYCGAVAVSWYRSDYTISAINRLIAAGVKTNIHFVVNVDTIDEILDKLENDGFPKGINAVVLLTHKPVGLGQKEKCIRQEDPRLTKLYRLIRKKGRAYKVGVDGSFVVGMINSNMNFDMRYLDTCEAGRFTCYIDAEMRLHPCSFDVTDKYTIDLNQCSIAEAWNSTTFIKIRELLHKGCPDCEKSKECMGGCFLHEDIVLCPIKNKKEK